MRLDRVGNADDREKMCIGTDIVEPMEVKRLKWVGYFKECLKIDGRRRYLNGHHRLEELREDQNALGKQR